MSSQSHVSHVSHVTHVAHAGHGLRWDAGGGRWWWPASDAPALHAWAEGELAPQTCLLPDAAGLVAHCKSGKILLGLPKRLCHAELPEAGGRVRLRVQPLVAVDAAEPRTGICDGRTDRRGFLVFGTANASHDQRPIGSFYQYSRQHGLRRLALPAVARAGSISFSPDGARMYFADAAAPYIMACQYDAEQASVSRIDTFARLAGQAQPRGAVVDAAGCLWSAQPGELVRYDPNGNVLLRLAVDCVSPAIGGPRLSQLKGAGMAGLGGMAEIVEGLHDTAFDDQD